MPSGIYPTPPHLLVDQQGRPYFLWDVDLTLTEFRERLSSDDPGMRQHFLAKLMRQAKPDDAVTLTTPQAIADDFARLPGGRLSNRTFREEKGSLAPLLSRGERRWDRPLAAHRGRPLHSVRHGH